MELKLIEDLGTFKKGNQTRRFAIFECVCSKLFKAPYHNVKIGKTKSCGCLRIKIISAMTTTHGMSHKVPEYGVWTGIRKRIFNEKCKDYKNYGGRGIKMCERWQNSFPNFLEDLGPRPSDKHTIERIDNNGNYEPSNCRWATRKEQNNNKRLPNGSNFRKVQ